MKDGRTHLAHKAEHAVDMESGAVLAVTLQAADRATRPRLAGDGVDGVPEAIDALPERSLTTTARACTVGGEAVGDKGYHFQPTDGSTSQEIGTPLLRERAGPSRAGGLDGSARRDAKGGLRQPAADPGAGGGRGPAAPSAAKLIGAVLSPTVLRDGRHATHAPARASTTSPKRLLVHVGRASTWAWCCGCWAWARRGACRAVCPPFWPWGWRPLLGRRESAGWPSV